MSDIKTVDDASKYHIDPLSSLRSESVDRMKAALLSCSLNNPQETVVAMQQVTLMRAYHQVIRIVQFLDLMDTLEEKMYESISLDLATLDTMETKNINRLMSIQTTLQKNLVESHKLLDPYINMDQYPAFDVIEVEDTVPSNVLELPASKRDEIRENAGEILKELDAIIEA